MAASANARHRGRCALARSGGPSLPTSLRFCLQALTVMLLATAAPGCTNDSRSCACGYDYVVNASIWRSPEGDLFIAGYRGDQTGFVKQLNGGHWEIVHETPTSLGHIWGTSSSDFFVLGDSSVYRRSQGNWQSWNLSELWRDRTDTTLLGIWGTLANDLFVVGRQGTVAHFDGTSWKAVETGSRADLQAIWGTSGTNVLVVGTGGTILRYDGTGWSTDASPTSAQLQGIWGSSPKDVFAIAETVPEQSHQIVHYDGRAWATVEEGDKDLLGIRGASSTCVYAVGAKREGSQTTSGVFFYDGTAWTEKNDNAGEFLWDVWVMPGCDFYAVGPNDTVVHRVP